MPVEPEPVINKTSKLPEAPKAPEKLPVDLNALAPGADLLLSQGGMISGHFDPDSGEMVIDRAIPETKPTQTS